MDIKNLHQNIREQTLNESKWSDVVDGKYKKKSHLWGETNYVRKNKTINSLSKLTDYVR
jgi:hypothetical protein